ncbi:Copper-transporting ATPase 1 [Nymphon striatum]|nr:Copper-transporting ATPase 1 [Nymphon striatum]
MQNTVALPIQNMTCGGCAARVARTLEGVGGVRDVSMWLKSRLLALQGAGYPAQAQDLRLRISGLSCASCVGRLQNALAGATGVASAHVNLADETATLEYISELTTPQELAGIATKTGYPAVIADDAQPQDRVGEKQAEADHHRRMMLIAAALTLPVFILEMGAIGHQASWMIQFVLTTAVLFGPGRQFFSNGLPALWQRAPNMNSLVALGAGSAWIFSTIALFAPNALPLGTRAVYFEAAAVIVTLILLGRWFEARAKGQTGAAIQSLIGLQPRTALVAQGSDWVEVPVADLRVGDSFMLKPGERVPTDAIVIEGKSYIDESMLTGEPMQVAKSVDDALTGGTVNGNGSLICKVQRVGHDTTLAQIIAMVQQAQGARLPIQALVDRVTLWFVPAVMGIAMLTVAVWLTLCDVKIIALDKTGTLTMGKPMLTELVSIDPDKADHVLAQVAAIEARSEHPVAQAVLQAAKDKELHLPEVSNLEVISGQGITGLVEGQRIAVGNSALMQSIGAAENPFAVSAAALSAKGKTVFFAAVDGNIAALFAVSDPVRPTSAAAIATLKIKGVEVIAEVMPEGKTDALKSLRMAHGAIAFVGDGINDAPVLAEADVGIAIGTGTDVAIETADVVLMSGDVQGVVHAFDLSRQTLRNIKQNLIWAFGYNIALIPVAAGALYPAFGVLLSPGLAAGAMAFSSVFVLGNALRLRRVGVM